MTNLNYVSSIVLAAATLAVILTYVLGEQPLLQSPYTEPIHRLIMSLIQGISGPALSESPKHGGPTFESQMQSSNYGLLGNNVLGGQSTLPAGGLAVVVLFSLIPLAAATFVVSWKQRSYVVTVLLMVSGIILTIRPLIATGYLTEIEIPGPILGLMLGVVILSLGIVKGIKTANTTATIIR